MTGGCEERRGWCLRRERSSWQLSSEVQPWFVYE
ncbi:hypothetical protein OIU77_001928 [Salix suchowensis]|uniref:Uncharacterized protein n=1 Tax=Salix suchowensis TaxID=1278906 RepID=A0ABQ9B506_9ROSI|nr:hypothetical protein OIU77_001928 [Salix suchowensis]